MKKQTLTLFCFSGIVLLSACVAGTTPQPFSQRSNTEIAKIVGDIQQPSRQPWLNYVFDIQVTSGDAVLRPFNESLLYPSRAKDESTRVLLRPSSIGTRDGVKGVQVSTGLWQEHSLNRAKAHLPIDLTLKPTGTEGAFEPDTNTPIKARLVCEEWAQALVAKNAPPTKPDRLKQAFIDNWKKERTAKVKTPLAPYKVGVYWVIPVEVNLEHADFRANCL
jgi:hypothetical protein